MYPVPKRGVISCLGRKKWTHYWALLYGKIHNWPKPENTKGVERLCGFANNHRNFIKHLEAGTDV